MTQAKKKIHVNQHVIRRNNKVDLSIEGALKELEPCLAVKQGKENHYGYEVVVEGNDGEELLRVKYSPDKPLSCGARVWIESSQPVKIRQSLEDDDYIEV